MLRSEILDTAKEYVTRDRAATHGDDFGGALSYEPDTGQLRWVKTNSPRAQAGSIAGCKCKSKGYILVRVNNRLMSAHRIIWMLVYGEYPSEIDHIDGDRSNNRIENLRSVNRSGNNQNRGIQKNNISGVTGVRFDQERSKWSAQIQVNKKIKHLGRFKTMEEAAAAYAEAKAKLHDTEPSVVPRQAFKVMK